MFVLTEIVPITLMDQFRYIKTQSQTKALSRGSGE